MSETIEQQAAPETQPPAEDKTDAMRVQLLEAKNQELIKERRADAERLKDMERKLSELASSQQKQKQDNLVKNQEFEQLWKDASQSNSTLQDQLLSKEREIEELKSQFQQQQIKATALQAFNQSGVNAGEHLYKIIGDQLRVDQNGNVVALHGGVEVDLNSHLSNLKSPGSGFEMFFAGSGARGMSAVATSTTTAGGKTWSSMSFTEKVAAEEQDRINGTNEVARLKAAG